MLCHPNLTSTSSPYTLSPQSTSPLNSLSTSISSIPSPSLIPQPLKKSLGTYSSLPPFLPIPLPFPSSYLSRLSPYLSLPVQTTLPSFLLSTPFTLFHDHILSHSFLPVSSRSAQDSTLSQLSTDLLLIYHGLGWVRLG